MNVTIIAVGKLKENFFIAAAEEYKKRLSAYCKLTVTEIEAAKLPSAPNASEISQALLSEEAKIIKAIPKNTTVIAMCVEGKEMSSEKFARLLDEYAVNGESSITFIIGGSYGLSENVKSQAKLKFSMSPMTFPHRLFRVMLLEQVYRAFKINEGSNYHK